RVRSAARRRGRGCARSAPRSGATRSALRYDAGRPMARAAAKRTPRPRTEHHGRQRRPGGGGVEQTLFFQRIRRQAKWVFVFLALVFAASFVVFGVGSGSTGIGDLLRGNFGGIFGSHSSSGSPS